MCANNSDEVLVEVEGTSKRQSGKSGKNRRNPYWIRLRGLPLLITFFLESGKRNKECSWKPRPVRVSTFTTFVGQSGKEAIILRSVTDDYYGKAAKFC
jgi:hypothetical protein